MWCREGAPRLLEGEEVEVSEMTKGDISEEEVAEEEVAVLEECFPLWLLLLLLLMVDAVAVRTSAVLSTPAVARASTTEGSSPVVDMFGTAGVELDALTTACSHLTADVFREEEAGEVVAAAAAAAALLDARV